MDPNEVAARRCARTFCLLASGGVRVTWACGASLVDPEETAVDVEILDDHLSRHHHHRIHLPQHHRRAHVAERNIR